MSPEVSAKLHEFGLDYYLVRSLARDSKHSVEKEHAIRLIRTIVEFGCRSRKLALLASSVLPSDAVTRALVSIAEHAEDAFRLASIETLAEISECPRCAVKKMLSELCAQCCWTSTS